MTKDTARHILGIDPGLVKTGWGVIKQSGYDSIEYVDCGVIRTSNKDTMCIRLQHIYKEVSKIITKYDPNFTAIEEVFINSNPETSKKLIMARTASYIACGNLGNNIHEYSPNTIKKNITGNGHASKDHVYTMIQKILRTSIEKDDKLKTEDSMDAIAVAICNAFDRSNIYKRVM